MNKQAFQLYGFTPLRVKEKYVAVCHVCGENLIGTTASELKLHRSECHNSEEEYVIEVIETTEDNIEENVNPLELSQDVSEIKGQYKGSGVEEENFNATIAYETDTEHKIFYVTGETAKLNKNASQRTSDAQRRPPANKPKPKLKQYDEDLLKNLSHKKLKSQINYLRHKTKFYKQEIEKLGFVRTSLILKTKKLGLQLKNT